MNRITTAVFALCALLAVGCDSSGAAGNLGSGAVMSSVPPFPADDLAEAVRFRTTFGLRADELWIRQVAADASSWRGVADYGTPLTPEEMAELDRRQRNAEGIVEVVEAYGRDHPEEWAGLFVDHEASGVVAVLFTGHLDEHATAIRQLVHPGARFEVRSARWSRAELEAFRDRVRRAEAWLSAVDAWLEAVDVHERRNVVLLRVSSRNSEAPRLIANHFGNPGWLVVESDGIGRWTGPRGSLEIRAVTAAGEPARHLDCIAIPDDPAAGGYDGGTTTGEDGTCLLEDLGATWYTLELRARDEGTDEWVTVARSRVPISANSRTTITLVAERAGTTVTP